MIALCRCCRQVALKSLAEQKAAIMASAQSRGIQPDELPPDDRRIRSPRVSEKPWLQSCGAEPRSRNCTKFTRRTKHSGTQYSKEGVEMCVPCLAAQGLTVVTPSNYDSVLSPAQLDAIINKLCSTLADYS